MDTARKIMVEIPAELLEKAKRASGSGICSNWAAACCRVAGLCSFAATPKEGTLFADRRGAESGPMIAADTSTWIAFLEGEGGEDEQQLDKALQDRQELMLPVVLTELLSDPELPSAVAKTLSKLPPVDIEAGYWQGAGAIRVKVLAKRLRARLGDVLIAQSCIDHSISLLTRDRDFCTFAETAHLNLVIQ